MSKNAPAFPVEVDSDGNGLQTGPSVGWATGLTKMEYFLGQALANPNICTGDAPDYQLRAWFGERTGITRAEIVAKQAAEYAKSVLTEGEKG